METTVVKPLEKKKSIDLLRFFTAGSVDDGKSTLIGRLLYDCGALFEDQLAYLQNGEKTSGELDFSRLTDGLKDEMEQGITIDVAYRYFETERRKFIIADSPGHFQYTRNMMTAASSAGLGVFLADAFRGITEQTKRHLYLSSLMQVPRAIVCINKMDLVEYSEDRYNSIQEELHILMKKLGFRQTVFIPVSALRGDMVVERCENMPWYKGLTLRQTLEEIQTVSTECRLNKARFVVQNVLKNDLKLPAQIVGAKSEDGQLHPLRLYAGRMLSGTITVGDEVTVNPGNLTARVTAIYKADKPIQFTTCPLSVAIALDKDIDIGRGSLITNLRYPPKQSDTFEAYVCCTDSEPLVESGKYLLTQLARTNRAKIVEVISRVDVSSLQEEIRKDLAFNDIAHVRIKVAKPVVFDSYQENRDNGSFLLLNEKNNHIQGAGIIIN